MTIKFLNARLAGVFIILLLLSGCARNPVLLQSTYQALPPHTEITSVPFYAQTEFQCGPATLAMVLNHQDVETDVKQLIPQVFLPERDGSVQPEMLATVRRYDQRLSHSRNHGYPVRSLSSRRSGSSHAEFVAADLPYVALRRRHWLRPAQ